MSNLDFNLSTTSKFMGPLLIYFGIQALRHIACEIISIYKERELRLGEQFRVEQCRVEQCRVDQCRIAPGMNIAKIMNPMNPVDRIECRPFARRFPVKIFADQSTVNAEQDLRAFMEKNSACSCLPDNCPITRVVQPATESDKCKCKINSICIGAAYPMGLSFPTVQPCSCPDASSDASPDASPDASSNPMDEMTSGTILHHPRPTLSPSSSQSPLSEIMSTLPDRRNVMAASLKPHSADNDNDQMINIQQREE